MSQHSDITIVIKYNNQFVGITTVGDGWNLIKEQFDRMGCCDVMICACHNNQKVLDSILKYKNHKGCQITDFEKNISSKMYSRCIRLKNSAML